MSGGSIKKNTTFDGDELIVYFENYLKVHLKPANENEITYEEMLEGIEKTLTGFHVVHEIPNRHRIKTLAINLFYGYAMILGYEGDTKNIIHTRHCYSYSLQKQLEVSELRCKSLGGWFTRGSKIAKVLFKQFKRIKRKSPSRLLDALSVGNVCLGPMLANSHAENQKLNFEDLSSLKESSFDDLFNSFNLSVSHSRSHAIIKAGIKGFVEATSSRTFPSIKHPLLDELREFKNGDSSLIQAGSVDNTLVQNMPRVDSSSNEILEDTIMENNNLNETQLGEIHETSGPSGTLFGYYDEERLVDSENHLSTLENDMIPELEPFYHNAESDEFYENFPRLTNPNILALSENYVQSHNTFDPITSNQEILAFANFQRAAPTAIRETGGFGGSDSDGSSSESGNDIGDHGNEFGRNTGDRNNDEGESSSRAPSNNGDQLQSNNEHQAIDEDQGIIEDQGNDEDEESLYGDGDSDSPTYGEVDDDDVNNIEADDRNGDDGNDYNSGGDDDNDGEDDYCGFDLPKPDETLLKQFFERDYRSCFNSDAYIENLYALVFQGEMSYETYNGLTKSVGVRPEHAHLRDPSIGEIRRLNEKVEKLFYNIDGVRSLVYCKCLQTVYSRQDNESLTECQFCHLPRSEGNRFFYGSIRLSIMTIFLNSELLEHVKSVRNRSYDPNFVNSVQEGLFFRETLAMEAAEKQRLLSGEVENPHGITDVIYLSLFISADGCNMNKKSYAGVFPSLVCFLDLPLHLRTKDQFTDIPIVSRTARDSPGSTAKILEIFYKDLEDLEINGMIIRVSPQETYLVKVRINTVSGDIIAVNKLTETKGPTARHPCTYCTNEVTSLYRMHIMMKIINGSNLTPEQRKVVINNVTSQYMRDLVADLEDPLPVPRAEYLGYDIKAKFVLCHHSTLDIMRVLKPDYMHIYYENIFVKTFVKLFTHKNIDPNDKERMKTRRGELFHHFNEIKAFEEPVHASKLFSADSINTPIKAADIRTVAPCLFSFFDFVYHANDEAAPDDFYSELAGVALSRQGRSESTEDSNTEIPTTEAENVAPPEGGSTLSGSNFIELVYLMVELNIFLQALGSFDVPLELIDSDNGPSTMKLAYIALLVSIQLYSEREGSTEFVDELFRLPCHCVLHMIDRWKDVGNYNEVSCWCTERGCKTVRNMQHSAGNVYRTMIKRLIFKLLHNNYERYSFSELALSRFVCPRTAVRSHMLFRREIEEANSRCGLYNPKVRVQRNFKAIGIFKLDIPARSYGKFKRNGEWVFFKAVEIIKFEYVGHTEILLKFKRVEIRRKWKQGCGLTIDFCYTAIIHDIPDAPEEEMFLENDTLLFSLIATDNNALIDKHPSFADLIRLH